MLVQQHFQKDNKEDSKNKNKKQYKTTLITMLEKFVNVVLEKSQIILLVYRAIIKIYPF